MKILFYSLIVFAIIYALFISLFDKLFKSKTSESKLKIIVWTNFIFALCEIMFWVIIFNHFSFILLFIGLLVTLPLLAGELKFAKISFDKNNQKK